ncbi:MAG: aldo/keto reductase [Bernardetiaceae bacterium]|jgi:aryl-alcohol dehydrogenase-like predicted oxidoreductase|nr:aldo/keto reductase [Bernardetiaceae bacterium]
MNLRKFGQTSLEVSEIGFGAWAIGGPAKAGSLPIGWGRTDDACSVRALHRALDLGINFYDTADFYGLGHSETLLGKTLGNRPDVVVATKVGQKLDENGQLTLDYSPEHVAQACEASLRRLRREAIDFYQLHTAKVTHLRRAELIGALEKLQQTGKIRYWGVSLNTFVPEPEAEFCLENRLGQGFQLVLNLINQRVKPLLNLMQQQQYGLIARMPLQFGLLTGKFNTDSKFDESDHRSFRLTPQVLGATLRALAHLERLAAKYDTSLTGLALSFAVSHPQVATVIPGMRTPEQVEENTSCLVRLPPSDLEQCYDLYDEEYYKIVDLFKAQG